MDKRDPNDSPDDNAGTGRDLEHSAADKPVDLIPKAVLEYRPRPTTPLELLVDMSVGVILGRSESFHRKYRSTGLGFIGAVTESSEDVLTSLFGMPVNLDLVSPHVMLVAGKRGSGKSYTLGLISEELARAMARKEIEVAVVVIDTVDVFRQVIEPNTEQADLLRKWGLDAQGFPAAVYIPRRAYSHLPDEVKERSQLFPLAISPSELSLSDWAYVLEKTGTLSTAIENLISDVIDSLRRGYTRDTGKEEPPRSDFSIQDMIHCVDSNAGLSDLYKPATRTALVQRFRRAQHLGVFHPGGTSAQDLAVAGRITIVDVAPLGSDADAVLAILTNMLSRQILTYRMAWTDEGTSAREELPPTWLIVDEAQTLVPRSGSTPAKDAIVSYAKLGRRFGCSLVLCTQQPSAVSDEAISQADIVISHSLSHDADIKALQQRAPAVMPEEFKDKAFISGLPRGVALVFDQSTENRRGFVMQARPRMSKHGGTDRLSALLEATKLLPPEAPESEVGVPTIGGRASEAEADRPAELPEVPRPPLKLSRADWNVLDGWIREYVKALFERQKREYAITEESAPRTGEAPTETPAVGASEDEERPPIPAAPTSLIDDSDIAARKFGALSASLLEKAMQRQVLYAKPSHEFLFKKDSEYRETVTIRRTGVEGVRFLQSVVAALVSLGLAIDSVRHTEGFTFVLMRKDAMRASISVGVSEESACVPVVIVGPDKKAVASLSAKARSSVR